jgi:AsmA-like C-terminal region/AsmA family
VSRLRAALIAVAAVAAILVLAVWQVPQWLDWARYRATIEALASATLGQPVTISGPISLTLLPQPVLTASQVNVGGTGAADFSIHVEALRLRVAPWPLIGGHVDARELVLRGPNLRIPWPAERGMLRPSSPAWLAAFAARIEDGRLTVGQLGFTGIDGTLATQDTGALLASGTARFSGQDWHFTARLTAAGADGAAGLNVALDGQGKANGLGASFSGQLARDGTLAGTIAGRGPNLAVLLPAPPVPFRADGRLAVGSGLATADDLALEIGGSPASGSVTLHVAPTQRLDASLVASRLDLDAWLPVLLRSRTTIAGIDVPIGLAVSAESAPLGGGTLEHVRAAVDLSNQGLVVRDVTALLPGNASLRLSGRIERVGPSSPRFEGDARLDAPVLRTTLRWLDEALPGTLPPRLLAALPDSVAQRAVLSAHVAADNGEVALRPLSGTLDDVPVSGNLALKHGEPPAITVDLALDHMALDPWLPARLRGLTGPTSGLDAELRLNIRQATVAGTKIDGLAVDAAVEAGNILLRRIEGNVRGAHVAASGVLGDGGKLTTGRLSAETKDAAGLADLLPVSWRATPALWQGPATLDVQASGPPEKLTLDARLALADAMLEASPIIDIASGEWTTTLTLQHPGARRLLATLGWPERDGLRALPEWLGDGSLSLMARLAGRPGRLVVEDLDLRAATLHARGALDFDLTGAEPRVSGHVDADDVTLPIPNGGSDAPLPFGVLHGWQGNVQLAVDQLAAGGGAVMRNVSAKAAVANDKLTLEDFAAQLGSGSVSGSFVVDAAARPPTLAMQGKLSDAAITGALDDVPIDLLSGRADARVRLVASGYSPAVVLATLDGRVMLKVRDGTVSGFDLFRLKQAVEKPDPKSAQSAADDALHSGATGFDRLDVVADIAHGDLVFDSGSMTGVAGEAQVSGGIHLADRSLNVQIELQPSVPRPPAIAIQLTGPIDRPSRTVELDGLARWIAALVH